MLVLIGILLALALLFAVLDIVLANGAAGRRYWLLPVAVILVVAAVGVLVFVH